DDADEKLHDYVEGPSLERCSARDGLRSKSWRTRPRACFEDTSDSDTDAARVALSGSFAEMPAQTPLSQITSSAPGLQQSLDVVAVAEGQAGFAAGPGPRSTRS